MSSLPWAGWPAYLQANCFDAIVDVLKPDGRMVTFAYVHSQVLPPAKVFRRRLLRRFDSVKKTPITWKNLPPAFVFVCDGPKQEARVASID